MTRLLSLVSAVFVLLGVTMLAALSPVKAQDSTPAAMVAHPVVGLWRTVVSNTGDTPFIAMDSFHADGMFSEITQDGIVTTGLWQPMGERSATVTAYVFFTIDDRLVEGEVRFTVEVDKTGNALTEEGAIVGHYADDGSLALAVETPATATRVRILPVEPLGTPVLPSESGTVATPAA